MESKMIQKCEIENNAKIFNFTTEISSFDCHYGGKAL